MLENFGGQSSPDTSNTDIKGVAAVAVNVSI